MKRKLTGSATGSIILFFASSMLASVLGLRQIDRLNTETAWVAGGDIPAGQMITRALLREAKVKDTDNAILDPRAIIGKTLTTNKRSGDTFSANELALPKRPTLAQAVPEGRVLYTLRPDPSSIPFAQLRGGDRLDVLVTNRHGVHTVASDVRLIGVMRNGAAANNTSADVMSLLPKDRSAATGGANVASLVVAVYPQHVYPLASIGKSDKVSLVLHSARGEKLAVRPAATHREVEMVSGLSRKKVLLRL